MDALYITLSSFSFCLMGYLFGSVLFAKIIAKFYNINITRTASKNPGATNITRTIGKKVGILVSFLDTLKSYSSVILSWVIFKYALSPAINFDLMNGFYIWIVYLGGMFAVIGHCFPLTWIICKIRKITDQDKIQIGGKGVSSLGGMTLAISPYIGMIGLLSWFVISYIWKHVSLGSVIGVVITSFLIFIPYINWLYLFNPFNQIGDWAVNGMIFAEMIIASIIIIYRHKANIINLLSKNERYAFVSKIKKESKDEKRVSKGN